MGLTSSTLGAAFTGSYVNTAYVSLCFFASIYEACTETYLASLSLYGALCLQSLEFYRRFKDDRSSLKYSVR